MDLNETCKRCGHRRGLHSGFTDRCPDKNMRYVIGKGHFVPSGKSPQNAKEAGFTSGNIARDEIAGAVARGWCSDKNKNKVMDVDLAEAITDSVLRQLSPIA